MTKWTEWQCEKHGAWFGATWITPNAVDCIEQNCKVLAFMGSSSGNRVYVRRLMFDDAYRWVPHWDIDVESWVRAVSAHG